MRAPAKRVAVPPAVGGPCQTCEATRELRRDPRAVCSWCRRGLGPWLGAAEFERRAAKARAAR